MYVLYHIAMVTPPCPGAQALSYERRERTVTRSVKIKLGNDIWVV